MRLQVQQLLAQAATTLAPRGDDRALLIFAILLTHNDTEQYEQ